MHCGAHGDFVEAGGASSLHTEGHSAAGRAGHGKDHGSTVGRFDFAAHHIGHSHGDATDSMLGDRACEVSRTLDGTPDVLRVHPGIEDANMQQVPHSARADRCLGRCVEIFGAHGA